MTNRTGGQSPSSASSKASGGFISSISTVSMPPVTHIQSNALYISNNRGNSDGDLPHSSFSGNAGLAVAETGAADRSTAVTAPTFVEDGSLPSISTGAIPDDCTNNDDESTTVTTALYTGRPLQKHKLLFNDDENDPSSMMKPVKVRLTEHAPISDTNETGTAAAGVVGGFGVSAEQKDDAAVYNSSSSCTTNGASDGQSPQTENSEPIERCTNIRM